MTALPAAAGSLEKAKRINDRLTGVALQSSDSVLATMQSKLNSSDPIGAAYAAIDNPNNPGFYNVKLKNWATPWTNRDGNKFAPLNDYAATIIGIVRDGTDYRQVLSGDVIYVGNSSVATPSGGTATITPYAPNSNQHYIDLENSGANMGSALTLKGPFSQTSYTGIPSNATAGVMTTRAAARAFFIDGTNRAMFRFTMKNHLCQDMEKVQDITRPTDRIRRDVPRSPGGDSRIFMNTCAGCHSGMDPMAQAFAYYDFHYTGDTDTDKDAGQLVYTAGIVQKKYDINHDHFAEGFVTPDDSWDNYWRSGPNTAVLGWDGGAGHGAGAKSMGQELANSEAFAVCSVKKVFQAVCLRDPASSDQSAFTTMLNNFKVGYDLKHTFAEAAVYCSGN
ncbi:MAG TPA: hypothetical protein VLC91_09670 [Spongiibacteraceae bacterium]|nr:hypothetical protein [Spongiibacteraceae bacterium]